MIKRVPVLLLLPGLLYGAEQAEVASPVKASPTESLDEKVKQAVEIHLHDIFAKVAANPDENFVTKGIADSIDTIATRRMRSSQNSFQTRAVELLATSPVVAPAQPISLPQGIEQVLKQFVEQKTVVALQNIPLSSPAKQLLSDVTVLTHKEIIGHVHGAQAATDLVHLICNDEDLVDELLESWQEEKKSLSKPTKGLFECCRKKTIPTSADNRFLGIQSVVSAEQKLEAFLSSPQVSQIAKLVFDTVLAIVQVTPIGPEITLGVDIAQLIKSTVGDHFAHQEKVVALVKTALQDPVFRSYFFKVLENAQKEAQQCKLALIACCTKEKQKLSPQEKAYTETVTSIIKRQVAVGKRSNGDSQSLKNLIDIHNATSSKATDRGFADLLSSAAGLLTSLNTGAAAIGLAQTAGSSVTSHGTLSGDVLQYVTQTAQQTATQAINQVAGAQAASVVGDSTQLVSEIVAGNLSKPETAALVLSFILKDSQGLINLAKALGDAQKRKQMEASCCPCFFPQPGTQAAPVALTPAAQQPSTAPALVQPVASAKTLVSGLNSETHV